MNDDVSHDLSADDAFEAGAEERELATLQVAVLEAVLHGAALPGATSQISLPDLAFLPAHEPAPLARDNLARSIVDIPPTDVRLISAQSSTPEQAIGYLRFTAARRHGEHVKLGLEVWHTPGDGQRPTPLGGVQLSFAREAGEWRLDEPPQAFAS